LTADVVLSTVSQDLLSDGELVDAHLCGEREAFAALYTRFQRRLVRLLRGRTGDAGLAEDLAHETLMRALANFDRFDREKPMWPWLKQIALNLSIDHSRRQRVAHVPLEEVLATPDAVDWTDAVEERCLLAVALQALPQRQQRAITLCDVEGLAPSDAAGVMGVGKGALEQLLHRGRTQMRRDYLRLARDRGYALPWLPLANVSPVRVRIADLARAFVRWLCQAQPFVADAASTAVAVVVAATVTALASPASFAAPAATGGTGAVGSARIDASVPVQLPPAVSSDPAPSLGPIASPSPVVVPPPVDQPARPSGEQPVPPAAAEPATTTQSPAPPERPPAPPALPAATADTRLQRERDVEANTTGSVGTSDQDETVVVGESKVYCDSTVRAIVCDAVRAVPTPPPAAPLP
jgi:RNA polymerase sigma-70 factor (ECF subfamily)